MSPSHVTIRDDKEESTNNDSVFYRRRAPVIVLGGEKSTVGGQTEDGDIVARFEMLPSEAQSLSDIEIMNK